MKEKDHSLGSKLLGLFVEEQTETDAGAPEDDLGVEAEASPVPPPPRRSSQPGMPAARASARAQEPVLDADFATTYAKLCEGDDPSVDAILTAYGEMSKTLSDNILLTAMTSMIKGIKADVHAVKSLLGRRYTTLQNLVQQKRTAFANGKAERARVLDEKRASVVAQIQQLNHQIAVLTEDLNRTEATTRESDAADLGTMEAFNQQVGAEAQRLTAVNQFLEQLTARRG
jgi:uncharacterized small protein (DUF1192 family)